MMNAVSVTNPDNNNLSTTSGKIGGAISSRTAAEQAGLNAGATRAGVVGGDTGADSGTGTSLNINRRGSGNAKMNSPDIVKPVEGSETVGKKTLINGRAKRPSFCRMMNAKSLSELMLDDHFLKKLFACFTPFEKCVLPQVCHKWKDVLYQPQYWKNIVPIIHKRDLYDETEDGHKTFTSLASFEQRGFESVCLVSVSDLDICEFIDHCPKTKKTLKAISLKRSTVTDAGLEVMLEQLGSVESLELSGCNDFTEAGLWSSLQPRIVSLSISDCISVADESVAAVAQRLPNLRELNLQAYHVTDSLLAYFPARPNSSLAKLRLKSCWELTNHAVVNIVQCLPQLSVLSLSGCSKITDEAVELIAENMSQLKSLDLSWCPRITDSALEYVACDLPKLEELVLDRCVRITDTGIGFLSTMNCMRALYLRWCCQVQDFGLQHLYNMKSLAILSVAGCPLLTAAGLSGLAQLKNLEELELTNCPGSSPELLQYFSLNLPKCTIVH
ncbi:F-box/LRR-repeat protein 16-like [Acanthaster planci]|uniref:F-box/LRR-repeat protein 16-like n=1 Tax=Acanthaster planci TaxID=133434 RepID=A0A8B7YJY7_ACAPL|nr:F-box/LRR-repeat protein 16-like [Acanthaster planci]